MWQKSFNIGAYSRDAKGFDRAGDMSNGHMADWSARGQKDRIYSGSFDFGG